jgi:hypothetical protein
MLCSKLLVKASGYPHLAQFGILICREGVLTAGFRSFTLAEPLPDKRFVHVESSTYVQFLGTIQLTTV